MVLVSIDSSAAAVSHSAVIWPGALMRNTWANTDRLDQLTAFNVRTVQEFNQRTWPGQLFKVSWTLTPRADTIWRSLDPKNAKSLRELALTANAGLDAFAEVMLAKRLRPGNVLLVDFHETSRVFAQALRANMI